MSLQLDSISNHNIHLLPYSNTIRETRQGALDTTAGDDNTRRLLGATNRAFSFADLRNTVRFVDCNASSDDADCKEILKWIDSIA